MYYFTHSIFALTTENNKKNPSGSDDGRVDKVVQQTIYLMLEALEHKRL